MSNQKNESEVTIPSNQQEDRRFVCSECNAGFGTTNGLSYHSRYKHEGVMYECDQCNHSYNDNSNLTKHKQIIHEGVGYECDECDYKATRHGHLTIHKQSIHEGVRYECDECDHKGTTHRYLTNHKQSVHERGMDVISVTTKLLDLDIWHNTSSPNMCDCNLTRRDRSIFTVITLCSHHIQYN